MEPATIGFIAIGIVSSLTTIVVALIQHNRNKEILGVKLGHLEEKIDLKMSNLAEQVGDIKTDVACVEREVGKVKGKIVAIEKDVEMLKEKGLNYANN